MGVKGGEGGNDKRQTRSARKMKDSKDDSKKTGTAASSSKKHPEKKKRAPPKRKPVPRTPEDGPNAEQTFSLVIPFLGEMLQAPPPPPPPRKKRRASTSSGDQCDNPAEGRYDRVHSVYYGDLNPDERKEITELEREVSETRRGDGVPLRFRILRSGMSPATKAIVLQKAEALMSGDPFNTEKSKLTKWVDTVLRIPFGVFRPPPVSRSSPVEEIRRYIRTTEEALHANVYGHSEAKEQIIQTLAKWISNPTSKGHVLGIHGPPGVGKSTLVKHIGDALGTSTITIPLGGASDGSFLDGHSYVYEGSLPGAMVSSVTKSGCMNPVILMDELDKVSTSPKGAEIVNVLIHLTDPVQNTAFRDKYLGDVELDLSQAVFVFTFNDINAVHPVLRDRMLCIETKAYTFDEKFQIAQRHLLPRICADHGFSPDQFAIDKDALRDIVARVDSESGVRNMNRALEAVVSQFNFDRLVGNVEETPRVDIGGDMIRDNVRSKPSNASVEHLYL